MDRRQQYVHRNLSVAHTFTHICKANILWRTQSHTCISFIFACVDTENCTTWHKKDIFQYELRSRCSHVTPWRCNLQREHTPHSPFTRNFFSRLHNESWHQSKYITGHESAKSRINEFRVNNVWHLITVCGLCFNAKHCVAFYISMVKMTTRQTA